MFTTSIALAPRWVRFADDKELDNKSKANIEERRPIIRAIMTSNDEIKNDDDNVIVDFLLRSSRTKSQRYDRDTMMDIVFLCRLVSKTSK